MPRVLVTGSSGLIGAAVCDALLARGHEVIALDLRRPSHPRSARTEVEADVSDQAALFRVLDDYEFDHVVHLGAVLSSTASLNLEKTIVTNTIGTLNILKLAESRRVKRVVSAGTTAGYGGYSGAGSSLSTIDSVDESYPLAPVDIYAATKVTGEVVCSEFRSRGVDVVSVRPVVTYGPNEQGGAVGKLFDALRRLAHDAEVTIPRPWGRDTRVNLMFAADCADQIVSVLLHPTGLANGAYNLGNGSYTKISDLVNVSVDILDSGASIEFEADEGTGPLFDFPDVSSSRVRNELGWAPTSSFETSLRSALLV